MKKGEFASVNVSFRFYQNIGAFAELEVVIDGESYVKIARIPMRINWSETDGHYPEEFTVSNVVIDGKEISVGEFIVSALRETPICKHAWGLVSS